VIENIITRLSDKWRYSYYRTSAQAEIDLLLEGPNRRIWAVEIKRSTAPRVTKGFYLATDDIKATRRFVIYPGTESFPLGGGIEAMGIVEFLRLISE
jgi:hypothetical protein